MALKARIKDGSLFETLTGASFNITVRKSNEDVVRMSPRAMAHQIEQLREIAAKYNSDNKRLAGQKRKLAEEKAVLADQLAKKTFVASTERNGLADSLSTCQSDSRSLKVQLESVKDELETVQSEHLSTKSSLDETRDQLKQVDVSLASFKAALKETSAKLQTAEGAVAQCQAEAKEAAALQAASRAEAERSVKASLEEARTKLQTAEDQLTLCWEEAKQASAKGSFTPGAPQDDREFQLYPCSATEEDMKRYLNYTPKAACPNDWYFVQRLIFKKKCFSLPRRRCRALTAAEPTEPLGTPRALFDQLALNDKNVRWDLHNCKSFGCLNKRVLGDCRDCFNLTLEETRWKVPFMGTIPMKQVIEMKKGTLRLGIDVGGGTGSFAAHMARYGITIMTTAFNVETVAGHRAGLPYMEAIAARGLIPLHIPHASRLPFYDGVLDVIHSVNSIKYIPLLQFEELIYEWDRVLRPGGIFWFEMFYCPVDEMPKYVAAIEQVGYKKLYWNYTPKTDKGERGGAHIYLNCVLEKQPNPGKQVLTGPSEEDMKNIF